MNWLDYFLKRRRGPDINQPVPVGDPMKDLRTPTPQPQHQAPAWQIYNLNDRYRQWMTRERRT